MVKENTSGQGLSKLLIITILGFIALVILGVVYIVIESQNEPNPETVNLTIWGVWDDSTDLSSIISSYRRSHPYIKISYKKIRYEEYEDMLINGWATNSGPDIYSIPNTWINKYKDDFISPVPKSTEVAYYTTQKVFFTTETKIKYKKEASITADDINRKHIGVVYDDVIINGKIYALPLSVNTLVMYYNRDLLNQAHVAEPPQTWNEFTNIITKLALVDEQNNIVRAGTALGTYNNIPNASDIVTLLMLQNGTIMTTGNKVTFHQASASDPSYFPAEEALKFYTGFASPEKSVYTWNDQMPDALDYFASGQLAFYFGYQYEEPDIQSKSQGVDYAITAMPQVNPTSEINFANYWAYTVAKQSKNANEAWNFVQYAASEKVVKKYLTATNQTSVLRSILNSQLTDPDLGIFAKQALTAQSWYHGTSPTDSDQHFSEMITVSVNDPSDIKNAIVAAATKIQKEY